MKEKIKFTPEQLSELQSFFQNNDFTANMTLNRECNLKGEQAEIFVRIKKIFGEYWLGNLRPLGVNRKMKNFSKDYPVNFLENADADYFSEEISKIYTDPDIKISNAACDHLLPIVCQRVNAIVTFSGYGLQNIIGLEGKKLFLNTNTSIGDKIIYDEEKIKKTLEKMMVQKFFETLSRSLVAVDRETEYFLQSRYFTPAREKYASDKTKMTQLISVTSPVGSFSFRYDDANKIMRTAKNIKDWLDERKVEQNKTITRPRKISPMVEGIRLNFTIVMNVYEALLLKYAYPELVQCSENLALQIGDNYIEIDPALHEKYYHRLEGPITAILKRRGELEDAFAHFNLIFGGQMIAMNISVPCMACDNPDIADYFLNIMIRPDFNMNLLPLKKEIQNAYKMVMNIIESA